MPTRKKLIEVALPLDAINAESAREKSIRHGHPSTLHLWWARRPLAACRAVIFAQLVDDPDQPDLPQPYLDALDSLPEPDKKELNWDELSPGEQRRYKLFAFIEKLVKWENINDDEVIGTARQLIRAATNNPNGPPPLLDPFAGGGSIPLEAQRLGLEAHASDLNPVAVLINKALIEIPPKFANQPPVHPGQEQRLIQKEWRGAEGLAEDVRYYGQWMRDEAERRIGHLYPKVTLPLEHGGGEATVIAWLWARTVPSPNPAANGAHVPLVSSFVLSTKKGKETWVEPIVDRQTMMYHFEIRTGIPNRSQWEKIKMGTKTKRGPNFFCMLTETPITGDHIKAEGMAGRMGAKLMAIVAERPGGRIYLPPDAEQEQIARSAEPTWHPDAQIADDRRSMFTPLYGLTHFHHLFTDRQLVALTTFSDLVMHACEQVQQDALAAGLMGDAAIAYASAVATYLGITVSRLTNRMSTICFWDTGGEKVQQVFARQAIPMTWDFTEANPLSNSSGNWLGPDWPTDLTFAKPKKSG